MAQFFAGLSYETVVQKYSQTVASVCMMRLNNQTDAEDCFQDTFVKLLTKKPSFNDEDHLKHWLIRAAMHSCYDFVKKNRRTVPLDTVYDEPSYQSDDVYDVSWALMKVKPEYREVLYLHYCQRYQVKEIAKILGRNVNTVKVMLKRGRDMLKSIYGGDVE